LPESGSMDISGKSVGAYLREAREARGLELDDAARVTRIGKNYLVAIESEMFDKLPSPAYVKGFLRIYAGYLGLSGDVVVAMFDQANSPRAPRPSVPTNKEKPVPRESAGKGRWLVPSLLMALVLIMAYFLEEKTPKKASVPPAPAKTNVATVPVPVQPVRTSATVPAAHPLSVPEQSPAESLPHTSDLTAKGIVLRLKVNQDSWLNITIDGTISQQYDLKAGDIIEWKGERFFTLDLGNAGGIEGEFNGKPLKPFGELGKTAHVELKSDGT